MAASHTPELIAIIGCAGRLPGAPDKETYWAVLNGSGTALEDIPTSRFDIDAFYDSKPGTVGKIYSRQGGFLDRIDCLDHAFFGVSPREASGADPQQRLLWETAWAALEDAAIAPTSLSNSRSGVYFGLSTWDYNKILNTKSTFMDAYVAAGSTLCVSANRFSHFLNLRGPSMAVDTACSSSLVAVHLACQSLRCGESDLAIAGGANVIASPESHIVLSQAGMLAADSRCKTFDASADGYVRSEGSVVFVMKRLADAQRDGDPIWGVIRGSAVNHNGKSNGLTAPSGPAQQALIRDCLTNAGMDPAEVTYVETHGTGTRLGDPIEVGALRAAYAPRGVERPALFLGAAKAVVGHAEAAAGGAGLLKVLLAMRHESLPPQPPIETVNPMVAAAIKGSDIHIIRERQSWSPEPSTRRIAGVSSFGFGGANAHLIVEAPDRYAQTVRPTDPAATQSLPLVLPLSAKTGVSLRALAEETAKYISETPETELADICHTAQLGRTHFPSRAAFVGRNNTDLVSQLKQFIGQPKTTPENTPAPFSSAFVFSGQGTLHSQVTRDLLHIDAFKTIVDRCDLLINEVAGWSIRDRLHLDLSESDINQTAFAQPMLYVIQCALANTLISWGVKPAVVLGHSLGEFSAAYVANVFDLEDGLRLVLERARLMAALQAPGRMLAAAASEQLLRETLAEWPGALEIACRNAPESIVLAGPCEVIERCANMLDQAKVRTQALKTSHAFHTSLMQPIQEAFRDFARSISHRTPAATLVSSVTGSTIKFETAELWADHWAQQICAPVEFALALQSLASIAPKACIEIGTQPVLQSLAAQSSSVLNNWIPTLRRGTRDVDALLTSIARIYTSGANIDWRAMDASAKRRPRRINGLPSYAFERHRHWVDVEAGWHLLKGKAADATSVPMFEMGWKKYDLAFSAPASADNIFWVLVCSSTDLLSDFATYLDAEHRSVVAIRSNTNNASVDVSEWVVSALQSAESIGKEVRVVLSAGYFASCAVIAEQKIDTDTSTEYRNQIARACHQAAQTVSALAELLDQRRQLWLVTQDAQSIDTADTSYDGIAASLWGVFKTALAEYPRTFGGLLDLSSQVLSNGPQRTRKFSRLTQCLLGLDVTKVLALRDEQFFQEHLHEIPVPAKRFRARSDAAYLITGAFGGVGLLLSQHLLDQNAGGLLLQSKRAPSDEQMAQVNAWKKSGARIVVVTDPLTSASAESDIDRATLELNLPLAGIFHLAGARADAPLASLKENSWIAPLSAKADSLPLLRKLAVRAKVDVLAYFSSVATLVGSPAQANYVAANLLLEAHTREDRRAGLPAVCILWGPWAEAGAAAKLSDAHQQRLLRLGLRSLEPRVALKLMDFAIASESVACVVADIDWTRLSQSADHLAWLDQPGNAARNADPTRETSTPTTPVIEWGKLSVVERDTKLLAIVSEIVGAALGKPASQVDLSVNIFDQGLDSLLLTECLLNLQQQVGLQLYPREVFQHPTVESLSRYLVREIGNAAEGDKVSTPVTAIEKFTDMNGSSRNSARMKKPTLQKKLSSAVFLLSAPRSGSTLLRAMLAGHSRFFAPPELHLLQFDSMRQRNETLSQSGLDEGLIRAFMELTGDSADVVRRRLQHWIDADLSIPDIYTKLQIGAQDKLLIDKSPSYALSMDALRNCEAWFDEAKYIHLVRDPHGMMESFNRMRMHRLFGENAMPTHSVAESVWYTCNSNLMALQADVPSARWLNVNYEILVQSPEKEMRRLCEYLDVPFEQGLLSPHSAGRMTDGVKRGGIQVGDPNFDRRKAIDPTLARVDPKWRMTNPLAATTIEVASALGYGDRDAKDVEWMSACSERWVESKRGRISVCEWGDPAGNPVLILHGWQDQGASWAAVARKVAAQGFRVIAPDLRQHGRHPGVNATDCGSREWDTQRPTTFDFVADAYALLVALDITRVHVVGHSFGSIIAAMLTAAMSDDDTYRVTSLTFAEPILPEDTDASTPSNLIRRNLQGITWNVKSNDGIDQATPIRYDSIEVIATRLQHGFPYLSTETLRVLATRIAVPDDFKFQCPSLSNGGARLVAALRDMDRQTFMTLLRQLDLPVLWLRGATSKQRRERDDQLMHSALSKASVRELTSGHNLHLEAPQSVASELVTFINHHRLDQVSYQRDVIALVADGHPQDVRPHDIPIEA